MTHTLIVGGGHAGAHVADALRQEGFDGEITIVGDEDRLPYQRPPLSKAFLVGGLPEDGLTLRSAEFFAERNVRTVTGNGVAAIDRGRRDATLTDGSRIDWDWLVLAVGAAPRALRIPGHELDGILRLHTVGDASALRARLDEIENVVVVGGGFIGLEFASVAAASGAKVTVIETEPRLLRRSVSPLTAAFVEAAMASQGIQIRTGCSVTSFEGHDRVVAVQTDAGERLPAGLVLVGVGAVPNVDLALAAGLEVDAGIVVDAGLRTADPAIFAIGDCARFPSELAGQAIRLESVQNAVDQAKHVAAAIAHERRDGYSELPWFWSEQGAIRLQMAGLADETAEPVVVGDRGEGKFSVLLFVDDRLVAVESINRPADHMAARRLLTSGPSLTRAEAQQPGFRLARSRS